MEGVQLESAAFELKNLACAVHNIIDVASDARQGPRGGSVA